ncbi:MAG: DNA recombination protein RmuC [Paramuribaculum sp.]|nr:DNA recombination protein RmuC [Paramuribaculum sp.]
MIAAIVILSLLLSGCVTLLLYYISKISSLNSDCAIARTEAERFKQQSEDKQQQYDQTVRQYEARIAELNSRLADTKTRLDECHAETQERLKNQQESFTLMANNIMEKQAQSLRQHSQEQMERILSPLKTDIEQFRKSVTDCYSQESRERFSLEQRIKELVETNLNIGREARELATALRGDTKKQGDWGEMVLETILEKSGLRKGEEYTLQYGSENGTALRDDCGRALRPDVVVHYPGKRSMVIDSKVSLTAFVEYVNADSEELRSLYGKKHVASVMKHVDELADKKYQDYVGSERLDFVMMFIPNEAAYAAAMTIDSTLWLKAYDKRVLIVSPTQLVGSLRLIAQLWNHDRQTQNAHKIALESGKMYDKFVGFVEDMDKIRRGLKTTTDAYDSALKKLSEGAGNLVRRAENLREMGVKITKELPGNLTDKC